MTKVVTVKADSYDQQIVGQVTPGDRDLTCILFTEEKS